MSKFQVQLDVAKKGLIEEIEKEEKRDVIKWLYKEEYEQKFIIEPLKVEFLGLECWLNRFPSQEQKKNLDRKLDQYEIIKQKSKKSEEKLVTKFSDEKVHSNTEQLWSFGKDKYFNLKDGLFGIGKILGLSSSEDYRSPDSNKLQVSGETNQDSNDFVGLDI
jgi:hypothetical protein